MVHKAPGFAVRNLFFRDRVEYWLNLVELTLITDPSDIISIIGNADQEEWARVDFLTFTEVEA